MGTYTEVVTMTMTSCASCGIGFGISVAFEDKRREDHRTFYCPNGHSLSFTGENEAEKLTRQLKAEQGYSSRLNTQLTDERNSHRVTRGVVTKLRKAAISGTCAFCRRHFVNVERHVATKHPEESANA